MPDPAVLREILIQQLLEESQQLFPGAIPSTALVILDLLPRTAEGKVDRSALPLDS